MPDPTRRDRHALRTPAATTESAPLRGVLIALALAFLGLFLILPVVLVFVEAFKKGLDDYFAAFADPDAQAAIRLTPIVAGISVPLNMIFGLAASCVIVKFEFRGK